MLVRSLPQSRRQSDPVLSLQLCCKIIIKQALGINPTTQCYYSLKVTAWKTHLNTALSASSDICSRCFTLSPALLSFTPQRKELGVMVFNCSCLALDLHRVFSFYWQLQYRDYIPSIWSKRVTALYGKDNALELQLNDTQAAAYVSVRNAFVMLQCHVITLFNSVHSQRQEFSAI